MLTNFARYLLHFPLVLRKLSVLHKHSLFLDEAAPEHLDVSLRAWRILKREHGYLRSLIERQCVDPQGKPIPWYTYPAIEQLSKWDFTDCEVLEYGSGNSTLWWLQHAKTVTSIENSREWHDYAVSQVGDRARLMLCPVDMDKDVETEIDRYVACVDELGSFDVIIIDGVNKPGVRQACARRSLDHLRGGGLFVVDNSDWLPETCRMMRDAGFFEIDFSGLGPLNGHAETTSLFFKSDFRINPRHSVHPGYAIGGLKRNLDESSPRDIHSTS